MITRRLAFIAAMVAVAIGIAVLMPKSAAQPVGLRLVAGRPHLPERVGGWEGEDAEITPKEIGTLGLGTEFARKTYKHPSGNGYAFTATIVLSGRDISNSIHRPERCLDAQGWDVESSEELVIRPERKGGFPVKRLHNSRALKTKEGEPAQNLEAYTYYWFIGEHTLTASHWARYFTDNRDRIFRGVDQRWAFVTMTALVPPQKTPEIQAEARKWVDQEVRNFIKSLAPSIHGDGVSYN
jgi:hypothetical protein